MKFAYADPPYPGQAKRWYSDHPDYAGEVDHTALLGQLEVNYPDGWALSTSAAALQDVLALAPRGVRVAMWHVTNTAPPIQAANWWWSWEPVIVRGGRRARADAPVVRDVLICGQPAKRAGEKRIAGAKPAEFCRWMFGLLGARPGDQMDDLFPGSGVVAEAWQEYQSQPWLEPPRTRPLDAIERRRALCLAGAEELWPAT